jgi:hypothetical protein
MCIADPDWLTPGSVSFELIKGLPAGVITGMITSVLGYIAIQIQKEQVRVARAKLNLDLFEKRYKIFEATWSELSLAIQKGPEGPSNPNFTNLFPQAQFLFGSEIREYMLEISINITKLWVIRQQTKASGNIMSTENTQTELELSSWFEVHAKDECRSRFGRYLDFSNWR